MTVSEYEKVLRVLDWTKEKVRMFVLRQGVLFQERDIWWACVGENVGSEENGKNRLFERPVVIVRKFSSDMFLAVPCTSQAKEGSWYHTFRSDCGEHTAVLIQVRAMSNKRLLRQKGNVSIEDFALLQNAIVRLIKNGHP